MTRAKLAERIREWEATPNEPWVDLYTFLGWTEEEYILWATTDKMPKRAKETP